MNDMKLKLILEAIDKASPELKKVKGGVDQVDSSAKTAAGGTNKLSYALGPAGLAAVATATALVLVRFVKAMVDTAVEMQGLNAAMVTATGSQRVAADEMARLTEFAAQTPYQINEVVGAFIKLKNLGLDPSEAAMRSYGNTASSMNKSLNQMIEAVADAATGEFERLKEFGIKARQQGDTVKLTFRGVTTEIQNDAASIETYLRRIGEVEFAGGMQRQMETIGGSISNFEDGWTQLLVGVGETGAMDKAADAIDKVTAAMRSLTTMIKLTTEMKKGNVGFWDWLTVDVKGADRILDQLAKSSEIEKTIIKNKKELFRLERLERQLVTTGSTAADLKYLRAEIAYLKDGISEFEHFIQVKKELDSALAHNAAPVATGDDSDTEIPYLETAPVIPPIDSQWEIKVQKQLDEYYARLKVLQEWFREKYDQDIVAGNAMIDDPWMSGEFEKGLEAATERMWEMKEASDSWQLALLDGLEDLADYYEETFSDRIAGSVNSAFSSMEDTLVDFVMTGKASFKDMVDSILADITRLVIQQNISSPLASALGAGLSGLFGGTAVSSAAGTSGMAATQLNFVEGQILHDGGKVIPRFHFGGLASDEIPAILQTGERVLDREQNRMFEQIANNMGQPTNVTIEQHFDLRNYNGDQQLVAALESAAEEGGKRGYERVAMDIGRRGPIRRTLGG